jgi:hypothetical protein
MDPFNQKKPAVQSRPTNAVNPFARALAETEHSLNTPKPAIPQNPFSEALARTGGRMADPFADSFSDQQQDFQQPNPEDLAKQQEEMARQQKKEALRKKLHDQVNPVDLRDVFDSREKRVREELEKTREELKMLAKEISKLRMDVDIEATKTVVAPGQEGTYHVSFFQQLRTFIMLLRKRVQSARTWMQQANAKQAKKKQKGGKKPGMEFNGQSHEQGKTVFDMMHHERSSSYSGN